MGVSDQQPVNPDICDVFWGSHGCKHPRFHAPEIPHECDCCECGAAHHPLSPEITGFLCVAKPPYYGPETNFYGADVKRYKLRTFND